MWILGVVGCLTEAPEEAIVTQGELEAEVQAAVDAKGTGGDAAAAIEAYLQSPAGQAFIQQKVEEYLANQQYVTADQLAGYVPQTAFDTYVADAEQASTELDGRLATLETEAAASAYLTDQDIAVADCAALLTELDRLQMVRFGPGVIVELQVAPGVHDCATSIEVSHPQGAQIHILGNVADPSAVVLRFNGDGLVARDGAALGLVDGFRLVAGTPGQGSGILAETSGVIHVGPHVRIEDFENGEHADNGGIVMNDGADSTNHLVIVGVTTGLFAQRDGFILADHAEVQSASYIGAYAVVGGTLHMNDATLSSEGTWSVAADYGGVIMGQGSSADSTGIWGVQATTGGFISWRNGSSASASTDQDYSAYKGGLVDASGATGTITPNVPITAIFDLPSAVYQ